VQPAEKILKFQLSDSAPVWPVWMLVEPLAGLGPHPLRIHSYITATAVI
jgi:hypothetical protein